MASGSEMLRDAAKVIEDRHKTYGPPNKNFWNIARLWTAYLQGKTQGGPAVTEADVANMMVLVKIARLIETPDHLDSWTDIAGYAACGSEVACRAPELLPNIDREPLPYWQSGAKSNPSMPIVSEDATDDEFNR